jgi:3-dehydroquinate dehydratase type I
MQKPRIAAVIAAEKIEDVLLLVTKAKTLTEWVELRADYIESLDQTKIDLVADACSGVNVIFTLRDARYGGKFVDLETKRLKLFEYALTKGFKYYDVDFEAIEEYYPLIQGKMDKIILSYHNFKETPDSSILESVYQSMKMFTPGIVKLATNVTEESDVHVLEQLLVSDAMQNKIIVGMGKMAKMTRITFPLIGSYLTFAALDNSQSAAGQIEVQDLQKIYSEIFNLVGIQ